MSTRKAPRCSQCEALRTSNDALRRDAGYTNRLRTALHEERDKLLATIAELETSNKRLRQQIEEDRAAHAQANLAERAEADRRIREVEARFEAQTPAIERQSADSHVPPSRSPTPLSMIGLGATLRSPVSAPSSATMHAFALPSSGTSDMAPLHLDTSLHHLPTPPSSPSFKRVQ